MSENFERSKIRQFECRVRSRESPQDIEIILIDAIDKEEALSRLHREGHLVVSIREPNASNRAVKDSMQQIMASQKRRKSSALFNTGFQQS